MNRVFTVRLPERQIQVLKQIAKQEDRSVSAVFRRMIDKEVEQKKEAGFVYSEKKDPQMGLPLNMSEK
jgi:predicted transcriptional regulator